MKLYLIRHAQSENNVLYAKNGSYKGRVPDPEITDIGHQQAQRLAELLADESAESRPTLSPNRVGFGFTHLYCSLMTRSIQTAAYIAQARGMRLTALDDVFERGGLYKRDEDDNRVALPGPARAYFTTRFPELILPKSLGETGWYNRRFETVEMFVERMKRVVPELINRHLGTEDSVALVAHGHFIDQFLNELMGVERHPHNYSDKWEVNWAFHNTAISRIDFVRRTQFVIYLNRIDHLSPDLIT